MIAAGTSRLAAYALISFQTAYLKAHYRHEFMAGLLSLEMGEIDKTYKNIADFDLGVHYLQLMGVRYFAAFITVAKDKPALNPNLEVVATVPDLDGKPPSGWTIHRVKDSPTLAEKFPTLKTLKVKLFYFERRVGNRSDNSEVTYTVNVSHAKSIFQFGCRNPECINGDFDLTQDLARAVTARQRKAAGEMRCQGWRGKESIDLIRCHKLLRFELTLGY